MASVVVNASPLSTSLGFGLVVAENWEESMMIANCLFHFVEECSIILMNAQFNENDSGRKLGCVGIIQISP